MWGGVLEQSCVHVRDPIDHLCDCDHGGGTGQMRPEVIIATSSSDRGKEVRCPPPPNGKKGGKQRELVWVVDSPCGGGKKGKQHALRVI